MRNTSLIKRLASAMALSLLLATATSAQQAPQPSEQTAPAQTATQRENLPSSTTTTGSLPEPKAGETMPLPQSVDACIAAAADLGTAAESKTLPDHKADQLDVLFSKMETLCDGNQFEAAMAVANDIKTLLGGG